MSVDIIPTAAVFGAKIGGVDLAGPWTIRRSAKSAA